MPPNCLPAGPKHQPARAWLLLSLCKRPLLLLLNVPPPPHCIMSITPSCRYT